jgi:hypothetical protein
MDEAEASAGSGHAVVSADRIIPVEFVGKLEPNYYCRGWNAKRVKYCRARAGAGTAHSGQGRCRRHDGGGDGNVKHGLNRRYAPLRNTRLGPLIERYQDDPDALNVGAELAVARALLHNWTERAKANPEAMDLNAASKIIDVISKLVFRMEQIRQHGTISLERVRLFMLAVDRVLDVHVTDAALRKQIRRDIGAARV